MYWIEKERRRREEQELRPYKVRRSQLLVRVRVWYGYRHGHREGKNREPWNLYLCRYYIINTNTHSSYTLSWTYN